MTRRSHRIADIADALGCSASHVYKHLVGDFIDFGDSGRIKVIRLGRAIRVPDAELRRFLGEDAQAS